LRTQLFVSECIHREVGVCRQKDHQEAEDTDEIVVVQVGGFIHELDVGEAQEKGDNGNSVF